MFTAVATGRFVSRQATTAVAAAAGAILLKEEVERRNRVCHTAAAPRGRGGLNIKVGGAEYQANEKIEDRHVIQEGQNEVCAASPTALLARSPPRSLLLPVLFLSFPFFFLLSLTRRWWLVAGGGSGHRWSRRLASCPLRGDETLQGHRNGVREATGSIHHWQAAAPGAGEGLDGLDQCLRDSRHAAEKDPPRSL